VTLFNLALTTLHNVCLAKDYALKRSWQTDKRGTSCPESTKRWMLTEEAWS